DWSSDVCSSDLAAVDFYASLAGYRTAGDSERVTDSARDRRAGLQSAFAGLRAHSSPQVQRLWEALSSINGVRLYGPPPDAERTPDRKSVVKDLASTQVARRLAERGLFASHGDFYAAT